MSRSTHWLMGEAPNGMARYGCNILTRAFAGLVRDFKRTKVVKRVTCKLCIKRLQERGKR